MSPLCDLDNTQDPAKWTEAVRFAKKKVGSGLLIELLLEPSVEAVLSIFSVLGEIFFICRTQNRQIPWSIPRQVQITSRTVPTTFPPPRSDLLFPLPVLRRERFFYRLLRMMMRVMMRMRMRVIFIITTMMTLAIDKNFHMIVYSRHPICTCPQSSRSPSFTLASKWL